MFRNFPSFSENEGDEVIGMVRPGDKMVCGTCGLEVVCVEGSDCHVDELICCGRPLRKKAPKAAKARRKR